MAVTWSDCGGAIATGGSAQTLVAANSIRRGFFIQNLSVNDLWFSFEDTAVAAEPSIWLPPGAFLAYPVGLAPSDAGSIIGAVTNQSYMAREC